MDMVTYAALQKQIREAPAAAVPRVVSAFENDAGYQTAEQVQAAADAVAAQIPTVPTKLSAFENDARYQTATEVNTAVGAVATALTAHNTDTDAHNDIRIALQNLVTNINTILDSDDTTLDQLSEIVAYIKSNKTLIDGVTTSKVSYSDIVDNLVTNLSNKPLSAAQGVALKALIDAIVIPTNVSAFANDAKYATESTVNAGLATKQNTLTFDSTPTTGSQNPVTSGGVKSAIDAATEIFFVPFAFSGTGFVLDGVTHTQIMNAYMAGKRIIAKGYVPESAGLGAWGEFNTPMTCLQDNSTFTLAFMSGMTSVEVFVSSDNSASSSIHVLQNIDSRVTSISSAANHNSYPTAKAVYDYIESRLNGLTFKTAASAPTVDDDSVITFVDEG